MTATDFGVSLLAQTVNQGGGGGLLLGIPLLGGLIGLAALVLWIWALVDAIQNKGLDGNSRLIWVLVIIFVPLLGPILYFVIGRNR